MLKLVAKDTGIFVMIGMCLILIILLVILVIFHNPHAVIKRAFFKGCVKPGNKSKALLLLQADKGKLFEVQIGDEAKFYYLPKDTEPKAGKVIITQYILDDKFLREMTELANFIEYMRGGRTYKKTGGYTIK
jgi:hypothetical protein